MNAAVEADDALPFLRERVEKAFGAMRGVIRRNLERAVASGELAGDFEVEQSVDFIVAALEGSILLARALRSRSHSRNVVRSLHGWLDRWTA